MQAKAKKQTRGYQAAIVETQRRLPGKEDIRSSPEPPRKPFTRNKSSNRLLKPTNPSGNFQLKLDQPHSRKSLFAYAWGEGPNQHCGLILLDVRRPQSDGFTVLQRIIKHWPNIRVIMLSASATPAEVKLARQHGASGYLSKSSDRKTLLESVFCVASGGTCFHADAPPSSKDLPTLSARELEVLRHLGRGLSNEDLGRVLGVSAETVKSHLKAIFLKLEVAGRAEAVTRSYELGILSVQ